MSCFCYCSYGQRGKRNVMYMFLDSPTCHVFVIVAMGRGVNVMLCWCWFMSILLLSAIEDDSDGAVEENVVCKNDEPCSIAGHQPVGGCDGDGALSSQLGSQHIHSDRFVDSPIAAVHIALLPGKDLMSLLIIDYSRVWCMCYVFDSRTSVFW